MKIIVADDEREIRNVLRLLLERADNVVYEAENGERAVSLVRENADADLCIMDIMMPVKNGIEAVREIREFSAIPVLFLTARSLERDKIEAYGVGGDDYIVKPFSARELLMKTEALIRRYNSYAPKGDDASKQLRLSSSVVLNAEMREVTKGGRVLDVRDKEMEVLLFLAKNRGKTVSTDDIYSGVWGEKPLGNSANTVTVHILNLRRKLEDVPSAPRIIRTVWGRGYQID